MKSVDSFKNLTTNFSEVHWKRRPSEIHGYTRTLYYNAENGDYLRVDFNIHEKKVRLYLEDAEEGGIPYFAVIHDGRLTVEKNASTGRPVSLYGKFHRRAGLFSTIPNNRALKLVNQHYGIKGKVKELAEKRGQRKKELEKTRTRYFKEEHAAAASQRSAGTIVRRLGFIDFVDLIVGISLCLAFYYLENSFVHAGLCSGLFGISIGLWDMFLRKRDPIIFKIGLFLLAGISSYVYGYYFF